MGLGQPVPISGAIQKAYRDTLLISEAPSYLDPTLPIQPVAVIATSAGGSSVSVSDGTDTLAVNTDGSINVVSSAAFPIPSASQTLVAVSSGKAGQAVTAGTGYTIRSTTASKTFYLTSISVSFGEIGRRIELRDGGSGGSVKYALCADAATAVYATSGGVHVTFPTPIAFSTNVWLDYSTNDTWYGGIVGYEQ